MQYMIEALVKAIDELMYGRPASKRRDASSASPGSMTAADDNKNACLK